MNIAQRRIANACLPPVVVESVVADPEAIRALARANAPYLQPGHQRPTSTIWPSWRGDWASQGEARIEGASSLLHHEGFISAAAQMCGTGTDRVRPKGLYVNLSTPSVGQPVSHMDLPEFRGVDQQNAPGWFLQAMGTSGLFEAERLTTITAVSWFYAGERGFYRYWPTGRDGESIRHEDMWNTAVVGQNDFMHHKVERVGPAEMVTPAEMTLETSLDYDGEAWRVVEAGRTLARYGDEHVRLSLSWVARVDVEASGPELTLDDAYARISDQLGDAFRASSTEDLFCRDCQHQLVELWPGFRPG